MASAAGVRCLCVAFVLLACACNASRASASGMPFKTLMPQSAPALSPAAAAQALSAGSLGVAARGKDDYLTYCAPCHGPLGRGDGPLAQMLVPRPARHNDRAYMNALSDAYLFRLLKEGGPAGGKSALMGAWGRILSERQIRDLIAYMRVLAAQGG